MPAWLALAAVPGTAYQGLRAIEVLEQLRSPMPWEVEEPTDKLGVARGAHGLRRGPGVVQPPQTPPL